MDRNFFGRFSWGLLLVAIGVLFLLNQADLITIDIGEIIRVYWPVILILIGLRGLMFQGRHYGDGSGSFFGSSIVLLIGAFFLLKNLDLVTWSFGDLFRYLVPIILILFGLKAIFSPGRRRGHWNNGGWNNGNGNGSGSGSWNNPVHWDPNTPPPPADPLEGTKPQPQPQQPNHHAKQDKYAKHHGSSWSNGRDSFNKSGFIGDVHLGHDYWELKPSNISHFIGDTFLDLTKAQVPFGETKITISSFIGDVKVIAPNDPEVGIHVVSSAFLGDTRVFDRHTGGMFKSTNSESPFYADAPKKIRIVASAFIGDVSVTRVG